MVEVNARQSGGQPIDEPHADEPLAIEVAAFISERAWRPEKRLFIFFPAS